MARRIQVRNVPSELHRELVSRAKARGQTLTAYVEDILKRNGKRPGGDDLVERFLAIEPIDLDRPFAKYIRLLRKTLDIKIDP